MICVDMILNFSMTLKTLALYKADNIVEIIHLISDQVFRVFQTLHDWFALAPTSTSSTTLWASVTSCRPCSSPCSPTFTVSTALTSMARNTREKLKLTCLSVGKRLTLWTNQTFKNMEINIYFILRTWTILRPYNMCF